MGTLFPERLLRRVTFLLLTLPLGVVYFGVLIGGLAGVGGAEAGSGSGLRGLADRLGALGGELQVRSPRGEGTRLTATIPLDQPEPAPELTVAAAAETGGLGRRILQSRAVVYALVMALLVFVWLTTGADYFWPQWPIAGWGLVLALHAWFARARPVGMLDRQTRPDR